MLSFRDKNTAAVIAQNRDMVNVSACGSHLPSSCNWKLRECVLPKSMAPMIEDILNFSVRNDDVLVVTSPKCGTTWMQEAAWLILNNLDYQKALTIPLPQRSLFMEFSGLYDGLDGGALQVAADFDSPRLLKSHLPANLIPREMWQKKTKIIYVARNPKDVTVSFYHFHQGLGTWHGSLNQFVKDFMSNDLMYTPFWPHIIDFWQMRNESNIFFTTFEAMKKDLPGVLRKLTAFLEKPELSDAEISKLVDHLSFEQMKENKMTNLTDGLKALFSFRIKSDFEFMRRGTVGSYKEELSDECIRDINNWSENCLKEYHVTMDEIFNFK